MALSQPVGYGRNEPNNSPVCKPPTGRIKWTYNPFNLVGELFGPEAKRYLYYIFFSIVVIYCLYVWVPVISGSIIGNLLTK
jgi:hypothetical protein